MKHAIGSIALWFSVRLFQSAQDQAGTTTQLEIYLISVNTSQVVLSGK